MAKSRRVLLSARLFRFEMLTFQCSNCFTLCSSAGGFFMFSNRNQTSSASLLLDGGCSFLLSVCVCVSEVFVGILSLECLTGHSVVMLTQYLYASSGSFVDSWIIVFYVSFVLWMVFHSSYNKMLPSFKALKVTRKVSLEVCVTSKRIGLYVGLTYLRGTLDSSVL